MGFDDMLLLARRDFLVCKSLELSFPEDFAVSAAMYHIQQAVEKELKALLLLYGQSAERGHNIAKIAASCQSYDIPVPDSLNEIADTLTQWESSVRYDPFIDFTGNKYERAKTAFCELDNEIQTLLAEMQKQNEVDEVEIDDDEER